MQAWHRERLETTNTNMNIENAENAKLREHIKELEETLSLYRRRDHLKELLRRERAETETNVPESYRPVIDAVIKVWGITEQSLFSPTRTRQVADARQAAIALMFEVADARRERITLESVGRYFNRDHGTVIHAKRAVSDKEIGDRSFNSRMQLVRAAIDGSSQNFLGSVKV